MKKRILWIIAWMPLLVTAAVLPGFPMMVPMHYNMAGKIDRWGVKYEQLLFPICILLFHFYWLFLLHCQEKKRQSTESDKEKQEIKSNLQVLYYSALGTQLLFVALHFAFLYSAWTQAGAESGFATVLIEKVSGIGLGILCILLGNIMPKARRNSMFGLRTSWSMRNDQTWAASQRAAGKLMMAAGIMILLISLIWDSFLPIAAASLACIIVTTAGAVLYSYEISRQYGEETEG